MDSQRASSFINGLWDGEIVPALSDYIRIPNKSPAFDPDWEKNGHMDRAVSLFADWAREKLKAFESRQGWAELPAIKNGQLFGVYQGASRTLSDFAMVQYIAKQLYPEQFKDVDPVANYLGYYKKYLPVVPEGTFGISVKN